MAVGDAVAARGSGIRPKHFLERRDSYLPQAPSVLAAGRVGLLRKLAVGAFFFSGVFLLTVETPVELAIPALEVPEEGSQDRLRELVTLTTQIQSYGPIEKDARFFAELILKYSEEFLPNFDTALIAGHLFAESSFRANAINPRDPSYGLGQIMLPTAERIAKDLRIEFPRDRRAQIQFLLDPENNIRFSLFYLKGRREQMENRKLPQLLTDMLAIAAYNGNPTLRSKHLQRVRRILKGKVR